MTTVNIDLRDASSDGLTPFALLFTPSRRLNATNHAVLPKPVRVDLVAGVGTVVLVATDDAAYGAADWAYRVTEFGLRETTPRYVLVPTSTPALEYSALTTVDPDTLASTEEPSVQAIPKSLVTTKGDVIVATAASTPARLAVGTDGYVLMADSSQSVGVKWAAGGGAPVSSVNGEVGAVVLDATDVGAQPVDADLTTIAGLTATTDNVIQSVAGAWASRTPAQLKATLALAVGDVSGAAPAASPTFTGTVTADDEVRTGRTLRTYTVLTDAATIAVDAALNDHFTVTLGGNRTLGNPTNPPGAGQSQMILFAIRQDGTGSRTLALDTKYRLGADITAVTLSTGAGKTDYLGVRYNVTDDKWDVVAFVKGY